MRSVNVRFLGRYEEMTAGRFINVNVGGEHSVEDLLIELTNNQKIEIWDQTRRQLTSYLMILVNNISVDNLSGLKTKLNDGDTVYVIHPVEGG